jgi:hypothetical protein
MAGPAVPKPPQTVVEQLESIPIRTQRGGTSQRGVPGVQLSEAGQLDVRITQKNRTEINTRGRCCSRLFQVVR